MKIRILQLTLILLIPIICSAEKNVSFEIDGIKYFIIDTETVNGAGVTGFTSNTVTIPEKIQYKGDDYSVYINSYSGYDISECTGFNNLESLTCKIAVKADFKNHSNIKTVTMRIPQKFSFERCDNLESVTFTSENSGSLKINQYSFSSCPKLEKVTFPSNLEVEIGDYAFSHCTSLKSVSIPQITGIGSFAFLDCTSLTSIDLPNSLDYIGEKAFMNCTSLISLDIPNSVTYIGKELFRGCTNLKSVTISNSVIDIPYKVFIGCTSLKEVRIPTSVKTIGSDAFAGCTSLASINGGGYKWNSVMLPMGLETIGYSAFQGCTSLGMVNIPNSVTSIGDYAFKDCTGIESAYISNKVTTIGDEAFKNCSSLKEISLPNSVTTIGNELFRNCTSLVSAKLSSGLTTTGEGIFCGCTNLASVEIPTGLEIIGEYAFYDCSSLATVEIPNSVTTIGEYAFYHSGLTSIEMPNSVSAIGYRLFNGCTSLVSAKLSSSLTTTGEYTFNGCTNLSSVDIPDNVKTIGKCSFCGCTSLVSINIPASVTKIEASAFASCNNLRTMNSLEMEKRLNLDVVNIPINMEEIENLAFYGCNAMQYLSLPNSLKSIGNQAFMGCDNLLVVVSKIQIPFAIPYDVFLCEKDGDIHAFLYVPMGKYTDYKNCEGWKMFDPNIGVYGDADLPIPGKPGGHDDNVSITAKNYTITYGDELPEFEYTSEGADLKGTPEITCEATKTSPVGTYSIVVSQGSVTNSEISFVNGTLTITKAPLKVKAGSYNKKQGDDNPTFTPTYEGFKNDETEAVLTKKPTLTTTATKDSPVGTYPVTASGAEAKNYEISYEAGTLTVNENGGGGTGGDTPDDPEPLPVGSTFTEDNGVIYKVTEGNAVTVTNGKNAIGDVVIPDKVVYNGLEYTVTAITRGAFYKGGETQNTELTSITIPSSVERIEPMAFQYCSSLTSIVIPEGVTSIGWQAFLGCTSLSAVSIPSTVTTVEVNAFSNCTALNDVYISDLAAYCAIPFKYYTSSPLYYAKHLYLNGEEVKELVIPQGVTAIDNYAFYNCKSLNSVTLPSSLTSIGDYAFRNCENITQLISYIKTPESINSVFNYDIWYKADLIIPVDSKSKYEAATGWKTFQNVAEISAFDINHDYYINKADVNNLVNDIMGKRPANYDTTQDDITGDKKVDVRDVAKMVRIIKNRYPNTVAYLGFDPEAEGGDIGIDDPNVDFGENEDF